MNSPLDSCSRIAWITAPKEPRRGSGPQLAGVWDQSLFGGIWLPLATMEEGSFPVIAVQELPLRLDEDAPDLHFVLDLFNHLLKRRELVPLPVDNPDQLVGTC